MKGTGEKELPVHKRTIASQMSIFRIYCKKMDPFQEPETNSYTQNHIQNFCQDASSSFAALFGECTINGSSWFSTRYRY